MLCKCHEKYGLRNCLVSIKKIILQMDLANFVKCCSHSKKKMFSLIKLFSEQRYIPPTEPSFSRRGIVDEDCGYKWHGGPHQCKLFWPLLTSDGSYHFLPFIFLTTIQLLVQQVNTAFSVLLVAGKKGFKFVWRLYSVILHYP